MCLGSMRGLVSCSRLSRGTDNIIKGRESIEPAKSVGCCREIVLVEVV
jgi:hypothetical protein